MTTLTGASFIYLISDETHRIVKIGRAADVPYRLRTLQRHAGAPLRLLWTTPGGPVLERALHCRFYSYLVINEWFDFQDPPGDLICVISQAVSELLQGDSAVSLERSRQVTEVIDRAARERRPCRPRANGDSMDYVTYVRLQRMVDSCDSATLAGKRDRLLLVTLRALDGRAAEAAGLTFSDAHRVGYGLDLLVDGSKVPVPPGHYTDHQPARLFDEWLVALYDQDGADPGAPIFRSITKDDSPVERDNISPWAINQIVKRAAARAGLDNPERYTARIMRGPVRRKVER